VTVDDNVNAPGLRHRGRVIPLEDGDHLIGRGRECAIRIPSVTISRRHVKLRVRDGRVWVIDLGSRNGTWLNRERLRPNEAREMALGDHIYLPAEDLCLIRTGQPAELSGEQPSGHPSGGHPAQRFAAGEFRPAGARRRFLAAMIDMAIFGVMSSLLAIPLALDFPRLPSGGSLLDSLQVVSGDGPWIHLLLVTLGVWFVLWLLYFMVGWGMLGATPGQAIMGLRIIDHQQRHPIGLSRALLRLVAYSVGSLPFMAGHLLVIGRSDKRALHDMLAGTRVVRKPPKVSAGAGGTAEEGETGEQVAEDAAGETGTDFGMATTGDLPVVHPPGEGDD